MIKMFIMDCDGTMTNGKIYVSNNGEMFKAFDVKDGYSLKLLSNLGIVTVIITGRNSKIVEERAKEIGIIELIQNVKDKMSALEGLINKYKIKKDEIAYIGDDLNDLSCICNVKYSACPFDAVKQVKEKSSFVCSNKGGEGAVREFIDYLVSRRELPNIYDL